MFVLPNGTQKRYTQAQFNSPKMQSFLETKDPESYTAFEILPVEVSEGDDTTNDIWQVTTPKLGSKVFNDAQYRSKGMSQWLEKHPDAQTTRLRPYDVQAGIAGRIQTEIDTFDNTNRGFMDEFETRQRELNDSISNEDTKRKAAAYVTENSQRYKALMDERQAMQDKYDNNPSVLSAKRAYTDQTIADIQRETQENTRRWDELGKQDREAAQDKSLRFNLRLQRMALESNPQAAGSGVIEQAQNDEVSRYTGNKEAEDNYKAANQLNDESIKLYGAKEKGDFEGLTASQKIAAGVASFGKGVKDRVSDAEFWESMVDPFGNNRAILNLHNKVTELVGSYKNINEADMVKLLDEKLTESEQALLTAYLRNVQAQADNPDIHWTYKAGSTTADSMKFMAEFLLGSGVTQGAMKGTTNGMLKWFAKKAAGASTKAGRTLIKGAGKFAVNETRALVGGTIQTAMAPSTYANVTQRMAEIDQDTGQLTGMGEAILDGIIDSYIENASEFGLGLTNKALEAGKKGLARTIGHTRWGQFWSPKMGGFMKRAGMGDFVEEWGEEVNGAYMRSILGNITNGRYGDTKEWSNFWTLENQLVLAASFAPTIGGGKIVDNAQEIMAVRQADAARDKLLEVLDSKGYDKVTAKLFVDAINGDTPYDLVHNASPYLMNFFEQNKDDAVATGAVLDYIQKTARALEYGAKHAMNIEEQRQQQLVKVNEKMQEHQFWINMPLTESEFADNAKEPTQINDLGASQAVGNEMVRKLTDADGRDGYIVGGNATDGWAINWQDGSKTIMTETAIGDLVNSGKMQDTGLLRLNDYLDLENTGQTQQAEQMRMATERETQLTDIKNQLQPGVTFDMNTAEGKRKGEVIQATADGVVIDVDGTPTFYKWEQAAEMMGSPVIVKTDAENDEDAANNLEHQEELRQQVDAAGSRGAAFTRDGEKFSIMAALGWQTDDAGNQSLRVYATDSQGQSSQMLLSSDEVAAVLAADTAAEIIPEQKQPAVNEANTNAVVQRVGDWQQKLGVKINSYSTVDEIPDERVRKELQSGNVHTAWYDPKTDSVNFFLPNIADAKMVDSAVLHEVIAHQGLRHLLGSQYNTLLDRVWGELMDEKAQQRYASLVRKTASRNLSEQEAQRMAADEFIAYMAQDMDLNTEESQTLWQKLCEFVKDILDRLNVGGELSVDDLKQLLQASMTSYVKQNKPQQQSVLGSIPITTDKKGTNTYNWEAAPDAATALAGLRELYDDSLIRQFAGLRAKQLRDEKKNLEKRNPKTIEDLKAVNDLLAENTKAHMLWNEITALINKEDGQQEKRRKEVINTDTTGLPGITERFNAGNRLQGVTTSRTLAGGRTIKGHFELVESGAVTPSHNPETFAPTEGYPTNENGSSINDRDYEHDEAAQQSVRQKAGVYDQRAYQEPVIVSREGVVLSGNDRTMAGMIAADNGTDTQYVESLLQDAPMYGFTSDQVKEYNHPRLVFVLDEDMPYTTETMAMFNANERKTQNKTEQMVKSGKAVKDTTFAKIADVVSRFGNTADMYRDQTASAELMKVLMADGVLNQQDVEQYMDNGILSRSGQEFIESLIMGYLFNGRDNTVRRLMADGMGNVRRSIVGSLAALTANRTLGEYSLQDIMEDAIAICYEAHKGFGGNVGDYLRQRNLFESDNTESYLYLAKWFAIYLNSGSLEVRAVLDIYNRSYADSAGTEDVFGGRTAQDAIRDITAYIQNKYNDEIQGRTAEESNTADQRGQLEGSPEDRTGNQTGAGRTEQGGSVRDSAPQDGTALSPTDREWAAVKLIEAGADARLPELMSDEEIADFTDEYEYWEQFNDELGQLYIDLDGDLKSTDKAIKTAAQRRIDYKQAEVVRKFKPIEDMVRNLLAKYNLTEEEFTEEQPQANAEDEIVTDKLEEAPQYEEGASEEEIKATKYTQEEWEQFVYGGSYIEYKSERTGEILEPVMIDDAHQPIYGDHRVIVWRWKESMYKDRSEASSTSDYIVKYLKANRFRATEVKYVKNQYGFWTEKGHEGCSNPLFVRLPSVKKSQTSGSSSSIDYYRDNDGLWNIRGYAEYEIGGGSLYMKRHLFNTKSDALRAAIEALEQFRKEHPGNHYNLKDVDNLIAHLKTKVLPLAMKEDGEIDVVPDTLAVQGELFTFDNRAGKQPKKDKAKTKKETKKPAAKKAAPKVVQADEGEDETEQTNGRKVEPTETISFPDSENRIYLYEQGGKWESKVEVHADNGNMSGGPANPSNYPYNTREDAIRHALNYAQWYAKNIAGGTGIGHTGIDRFVEQVNLTQIQSAGPTAPTYGSQNTIITADKYEELKRKMRDKLSNLNAGFDPEVFFIGAQMAAFHVEAGARKFVDFAKRMIEDLGDAIRPYLKSIYNGARDLPGMEPYRDDMDSAADVDAIDVNAIALDEQVEETQEEVTEEEETETEPEPEQQAENELAVHEGDLVVLKKKPQGFDGALKVVGRNTDGTYNLEYNPTGFLPVTMMNVDADDFIPFVRHHREDISEQRREVEAQQPQESAPAAEQTAGKTVGEIGTYTHTKTGREMSIVRLTGDRLSADEFKELKARAKELGGYYSSYGGAKGFLFDNVEDATKFNNLEYETEQTDEQTATDTAAIVSQAASVAEQAQSIAQTEEPAEPERAAETITAIDEQLDKIDGQLALLGYYTADTSDRSKFHESYGYMKSAEEKARKDAEKLARKLAADLGIEVDKKRIAKTNVAPAGGDVTFRLPLKEGRELYVNIEVTPTTVAEYNSYMRGEDYLGGYGDDLAVGVGPMGKSTAIMYRVENTNGVGGFERYGSNNFAPYNVTYQDLLSGIRRVAREYLPEQVETPAAATAQSVDEKAEKPSKTGKSKKKEVNSQSSGDGLMGDLFADIYHVEDEQEDNEPAPQDAAVNAPAKEVVTELNGYKIGDRVLYTDYTGKTQQATIYEFDGGRPVLDTGFAPVMYELVEWDNIKPIDNGLEGNDAVRTEGLPADNPGYGEGEGGGTASVPETDRQETGGADRGGESGSQSGEQPGRSVRHVPRLSGQNKRNNHVSKGEAVYPKSPAARFKANIAAIRLLKELQNEGKQATKEQMAVLRQFTGWGGLGGYFNNSYSEENRELRSLLTGDEFDAAQLSINTAYYTPTEIIDTLWDVAAKLGFQGGKILEGSAGIGNILASIPKGMNEASQITAVELDNITGGILEQLYPDAQVYIRGFETVDIDNASVDLAITNVPFGENLKIYDAKEKDLTRLFGSKIHDFCIAKNIRKLRPGGVGIFISSRGTLDSSSRKLRQWIVNEGGCDVIGAFRLNNETFVGTGATADIIVVRKRVNNQVSPDAIDVTGTEVVRSEEYETGETEYNRKEHRFEPIIGRATMEMNTYFTLHPEYMGGEMAFGFEKGNTYRAGSAALYPSDKIDQAKRLKKWVSQMKEYEPMEVTPAAMTTAALEDTQGVKEGQLIVNSKGEICQSRRGKAVPVPGINSNKVKGKYTKAQVLADYDALKAAIKETLDYQLKNESDEGLQPLLKKLNRVYDDFVKKYGYLTRNASISFLKNDVEYSATEQVEIYKEKKDMDGKVTADVKKAQLFFVRQLNAPVTPTPETVQDGVIVSMNQFGRINIPFIAQAMKLSEDKVREDILAAGVGFEDPASGEVVIEYEYLSGNVREKLEYANEHNTDGRYDNNIKALQNVIPADIPAHLIEFSLGSDWLPVSLYVDYAREKFGVNDRFQPVKVGGSWQLKEDGIYYIDGRNEQNRSAGVTSNALNMTVYGHELMIAAMNNKTVEFKKTETVGDEKETRRDKEATAAATTKMNELRDDFKEWARQKMQGDEELAAHVSKIYNDLFNAMVPKQIRDIYVPEHFNGMANVLANGKPLSLRPHQARAVIRSTTEPVILAHEVGTGKTFTLITAAMEMRRLGTAKKPMIVVQNATLGQFVSSAKELYPSARILTLSEQDHTAEGRGAFYAKIRYNDWDLIIVPQSVFEMMPDSEERRRAFIQSKIEEKEYILSQAEQSGDQNVRRSLQQEIADLKYEYETGEKPTKNKKKDSKRQAESINNTKVKAQRQLDRRTDDVSNFDEMGIDALLIDEAHAYKHLGFATAMQRGVKGVDVKSSKRSAGVFLKTRSIFDRVGWKNVVFATGTPISNTAAEIWTFMKYLLPDDFMWKNHIYYFDDFVRNFGSIQQNLEFTTSGKFKETTRFAAYSNLPELVRIWMTIADVVLTKEAVAGGGETLNDKVPRMEDWTDEKGEKHENQVRDIYLPQSASLTTIMAAVRAELERFENMSGKEKQENRTLPLNMFTIAKKAAIDTRLVSADSPDEPQSKTNSVVEETLKALEDSKRYKGTCALFCDIYQRKDFVGGRKVTRFNLFDEIKRKLIARGVPADQIIIMESGMSTAAKEKIFAKVNNGEIRVIMGTTATLGTGVNIQERLFFEAHLDAPDRPMDYTQRMGRILRQGNLHKEWGIPVRVIRFGVEDSLDVTAYQRLSTKSKFINSVMDSKHLLQNGMEDRVLEEEEEGEFDNPVAILSGSEYALLKTQAERELRKLQSKKEQHRQDQIYIENKLKKNNTQLGLAESNQAKYQQALDNTIKAFPDGIVKEIAVEGVKCKDDKAVAAAVKAKIQEPISAIIADLRRLHDERHEEKHTYTMTFDGVKANVIVNLVSTYGYDFNKGEFNTKVSSQLQFVCDECGFTEPVDMPGGYTAAKDIVEYFKLNVANGSRMRHNLELLSEHIDRLKKDNELMLARKGKPFAEEDKLKEQTKLVEDLTEKMKAEMAAKEAKYAEELKNSTSSFVLHTELSDDDINSDDDSAPAYQTVTGNATQILDYYENPDGRYSYMSEDGLVSAVEMSNQLMDDERVRDLVDEYRRLDEIDRAEGRRDFTGGEMQDLVEFELLPLLREIAELEQRNEASVVEGNVSTEIFISNAEKAVQGIKQDKATPQQWLAMIQKGGGIKAGEDKWLGLSQWLQGQTAKTLTKDEVLQYIRTNKIQIEEKHYSENPEGPDMSKVHPDWYRAFTPDEDFRGFVTYDVFDWKKAVEIYEAITGEKMERDENGDISNEDFDKLEEFAKEQHKKAEQNSGFIDVTRLKYTTEGLDNKREIALYIPTIEPWKEEDRVHFGDAGEGRAIAWARFGDASAKRGSGGDDRVLFIDEIQSKRHQEGRKLGYEGEVELTDLNNIKIGEYKENKALIYDNAGNVIGEIYRIYHEYKNKPEDNGFGYHARIGDIENAGSYAQEQWAINDIKRRQKDNYSPVPAAPFDKNWHELTMKRMLRLAAEEGYDKIAWTTGGQQAERYNLGQMIKSIERDKNGEDDYYANGEWDTHYTIYGLDEVGRGVWIKDGQIVKAYWDEMIGKPAADVFGKDLYRKMQEMEVGGTITGNGLTIGAEGMTAFYDNILVNFMNRYGKQWGVSVKDELVTLNDGALLESHVIDVTPEMRASVTEEPQVMFQTVTDPAVIAKLEAGDKIRVYRAMQEIDGKLYPPMAARVDGKMVEPVEIGKWEQAVERPELADAYGRYKLDKGNGKTLKARYNPYIHTSRSPLNDQFTSAYDRPNLVTVEVEVPESELTSGYKAENAKDAVGEIDWHSGPVSSKLPKDKARKVILTRWDKPIRVVPDSEVAQKIAELLKGENIAIPYNTVTPSLRYELEQLGVKISGQPSGTVRGGAKKVLTDNQVKMLSYVTGMSEDEIRTLNDEGAGLSAENGIFASNNRNNERGTDNIQRQAGRAASDDAGRRADAVRRSDNTETNVPSGQSVNDIVKPLRKLEPGETCLVERKLSEAGEFSFIGRDRIESTEDVAFIFRKLETKAVENSFIVFVKDGKPTVLHVGMGNIDAVNVDLSGLSVMMKEIEPDQVYFVHNHPSGNIISSAKDRKLWALMQTVLGKKLMPGIIIDTTRGVYGTYMNEFDASMPEDFTGREGDVKIPTYRFDEMVFSKDYEPVRGERISTSRDVAAYVSSHRLGERDKISVLCINTNNLVVGNFFLPYTGMNDIKTINKIAVDCAYYAGITNARAVVVYGSGVDPRTDNQLDALAPRVIGTFLNAHGTTLLDMVGGKTVPEDNGLYNYYSYRDHGRIAEPGMEYNGNEVDNNEINSNFEANEQGIDRTGTPADTDGGRRNDSGPDRQISRQQRREVRSDLRRIQVLEREKTPERTEYSNGIESDRSRRNDQAAESERIIAAAKANGLFIEPVELASRYKHVPNDGKESLIYLDEKNNQVIKVKDLFATEDMTKNSPFDELYQHIIHNIYFPDTRYTFLGVTTDYITGDVRLVLAQKLVPSYGFIGHVTDDEAEQYMKDQGFKPFDKWMVAKDDVIVTDYYGDNILRDIFGNLHLIDPIIYFNRPAREIIDDYLSEDNGGPDDELNWQTVEPTDYEDSAADMTERSMAVGANLGVAVEVINEPMNNFKSSYMDGKLTINIGALNGDSPLEAALMAMSREMPLSDILGGNAVREFAQELYRELPEFRQKVVEIAQQSYGWDTARAMMEYLGSMAESTTDDAESQDTWDVIETAFNKMLDKVLDKAPMGWKWCEGNVLRYVLFQNAHQGDKSIATIARGATLAHNLGLSAADDEIRTDGAQTARVQQGQDRTGESAANLYNRVVSRMWARMDETYRDQFQSVNTLVDALEKASKKQAQGFEDIRKSLNQQSSKGLAAMQKWEREHWDKMMTAVQDIIDERGLSYDEIERYLMLKHGVERNDILAKRDARAFYQAIHDNKVASIKEFAKQHPDMTDEEIRKRISREDDILDRHFVAIESGMDSKYKELRAKDYGGLTGLYSKYENITPYDPTTETQEEYEKRLLAARKPMFDNMSDMELAADAEIADFEKRMGDEYKTELWKQINGATKAVLKHQYDANMMSRGQYEHVRDMFKYYVPLRGFAETTPEDMYSYYTSNADATFVAPLKQAKGRKTRAESPLAYIGAMASSAIAADIKNESKLALYYFVSNRQKDNDLVLVSDVWYVKQVDENGDALLDDQGRTIFEPQYPPFTEALSTDQAKAEYEQWENEMKQLAREHRAFRGVRELDKQRLNYVVNTSKQQVKSHIIAFKLGGRDMFMFINGNPRAAQAINGELNVDASKNEFTKATLKFLRAFASLNTSLNPEFWLSNLQRDTLFALMSVNIKEDKAYNEAFRKNLKQALKVVRMKRDLQNGKLGTGELEQNYRSFVENGGVTGYTSVRGTDVWEAEIKKYTGDTRSAIERAGAALDAVQEFGESFEQMTRFAAYLTSREQGKSVVESVADAKELTVNFNRKGSGKGITWKESEFLRTKEGRKLNDIERLFAVSASMLSVYGRHAIMFFNASVQGLNAMYLLAKKDKSKLGLWVGGYLMLGAMNAVLHAMLDGDDDDDDQYLDVPDYERRNNLLLGLKGVYLKWALPQEARVFYGMGDMIINHSLGREPHRNIVGEVASMIGEIAPLDATSGLAAVLPSITTPVVEVIQNEDYKGARVYNDNRFLSDEEKKHIPAYREPLKNTSKVYLALSEALNWISGGNEYEAGAVNWNPNIMEHIVEGYTGGLGTTVGKGLKFMENALGGEVKISDTPFLRRLMTWNDDRYRNAHVTDLYYYYREVAQDTERRLKEAVKAGDEEYYKKVTGSYDYKVLQVWKLYEKEMDAYDKYLRLIDVKDRKQRKQVTREHDALRSRMIRDISNLK